MSAGATFGKAIGAICLCLIGVVGLIYAWTLLVFSGDASPGYETATKIKAIVIAIGTVSLVGTGLHLLFRSPPPPKPESGGEE
ncbi:MAG: hypothetical protein HW417_1742 [Steroidobacteraceae bacterium]|nr:hypothetical protein [Steroidobacteraceae bacterium]